MILPSNNMALDSDKSINSFRFCTADSRASFKTCSRCKETLPLTQFWKDKIRPSGFDNNCKPCRNEASQGKRKFLTPVAYNNWRRKQCLERIEHWTNELNKTGCGPEGV